MAPSRFLLLLLLLLFLSSSSFSYSVVVGFERKVGGRALVKDVKCNKEIQELGRFSVEEYNRMQHQHQHRRRMEELDDDLTFSEVVRAETQVVSGIKYYLKVTADKNGVPKAFDAVVVVKPWLSSKQLLTFAPSTYLRS